MDERVSEGWDNEGGNDVGNGDVGKNGEEGRHAGGATGNGDGPTPTGWREWWRSSGNNWSLTAVATRLWSASSRAIRKGWHRGVGNSDGDGRGGGDNDGHNGKGEDRERIVSGGGAEGDEDCGEHWPQEDKGLRKMHPGDISPRRLLLE